MRIGRPRRPEFAAWRYGKQFIRRRVRQIIGATVRAVAYTLTSVVGVVVFYATDDNSRVITRVRGEDGARRPIVRKDLKELQLEPGDAGGWSLSVPFRPREVNYGLMGARGRGKRRLALEMAAHEESERRAMEGELAILETAWREAEEIAAVADRLLVPKSAERWLRKQKKRST